MTRRTGARLLDAVAFRSMRLRVEPSVVSVYLIVLIEKYSDMARKAASR